MALGISIGNVLGSSFTPLQSLPSTLLPKLTYNSFDVFAVPLGLPLYFFAISHVKCKARVVPTITALPATLRT
jgi:hypothetical protein